MNEELLTALPALRAFARSLTGSRDRADDLVQETVVQALTNRDKFREGTNLDAWLVTILRNRFYSEHRKYHREVQDIDGMFAARLSEGPFQESQLAMHDFLSALQRLPLIQREALLLVGGHGFSYAEAAAICGATVGTVKSRVSRARTQLQQLLGTPRSSRRTGHSDATIWSPSLRSVPAP